MTRSRTVFFIPDHFEPRNVPIAVLAESGGVVSVEPVALPTGLDPSARAVAEMGLADIREAPNMEALPDSCGPHVVLGPFHEGRERLEWLAECGGATEQINARAELMRMGLRPRPSPQTPTPPSDTLPR